MDEFHYITSPLSNKFLEGLRQQSLNAPSFLERKRAAEKDPNLRRTPDGMDITWFPVTTRSGDVTEKPMFTDNRGRIVTLSELKALFSMVIDSYEGVDDHYLEQVNLTSQEREFIRHVESNSGMAYDDYVAYLAGQATYPSKKRRTPDPKPGYIYVIEGNGLYKIGRSQEPKTRLTKFSITLPFPIQVLCVIPSENYIAFEAELHHKYADRRKQGEWFDLSTEDLSYLRNLAEAKKGIG